MPIYFTRVTSDIETGVLLSWDEFSYDGLVELCKETKAQKQARETAPFYQSQAAGISGTLLPAYQNILAAPGYSEAEKGDITRATVGGLGASYGGARDLAMNRMARTRNTAGFGETLAELARSQGRETSQAEAGLGEKFADVRLAERNRALSGLANLYGIDARTMAELLTQGQQQQPGFWATLGGSVAKNLGRLVGPPGIGPQ